MIPLRTTRSNGLAPVIDDDIRVLVLGSLPGVRSLQEQAYYAHPRNAFWSIMSELLGRRLPEDYAQRYRVLLEHGVGLWDVVESARRPGSLDSAIRTKDSEVNEFEPLLQRCRHLQVIAFNGQKARELFERKVLAGSSGARIPPLLTLPSTSPAHAAMRVEEKKRRWYSLQRYLPVSDEPNKTWS